MLIVQVGQKLAMVEQEVEIAEDRANTGEMHGNIFYDLYAYVHIYYTCLFAYCFNILFTEKELESQVVVFEDLCVKKRVKFLRTLVLLMNLLIIVIIIFQEDP